MTRTFCAGLVFLCLGSAAPSQEPAAGEASWWPQFRGPFGTGVSRSAKPPVSWAEKENVRWKTELPGLGHSSPIVWQDQVVVTSAVPVGEALAEPKFSGRPGAHNNLPITHRQRFVVLSLDRETGKIRWQSEVGEELPHEGGHETASYASASPVTDGERVYAFFGSYGLYCLALDSGDVLWSKRFGAMFTKHGHGEGASPALADGRVVLNWDHEESSFLVSLDAETGEELWRSERENEGTSWSTPIVVEVDGKKQVVVSATGAIRGYEFETGDEIWRARGLSDNVVATPVFSDGVVHALSSYTFRSGMAISLPGAKGDLTGTDHILWRRNDRTPYVPSPLLYKGHLYFLAHYQGVLTRAEAKSGEEPSGPFRIQALREVYASPVAADDKIYLVDRSGLTVVLLAGPEPELLGANHLEDRLSATPALVGDSIFLRGERFLYRIAEEE